MKRVMLFVILLTTIPLIMAVRAKAEATDVFDDSVSELMNSVSGDVRERMEQLGYDDADVTNVNDMDVSDSVNMIADMLGSYIAGPLSAGAILIAVIVLASLLESYTFSLRYVETKDVMNVVTSLLIITTLVTPVTTLIQSSLTTVKETAALMLAFVPIMAGIMAMSGHVIRSGGYYATVMTASQAIAQLSSLFFAPLLNIYLALSVSASISERVRLNGICELLSKLIKWSLTFSMTIFTAILSIRGFAASAADSVASKALRFTFSSFIPIVGSSVSEAYKAIEGSVGLLRSGVGVFALIALIISYLPIILQIFLWQLCVNVAKTVAETFDISSTASVLASVSSVLSVLLAIVVCMMSVFLVSGGVLTAIGGAS